TTHACNDAPNAVWAIDLNVDPPKVRSFELKSGSNWGLGGPVIGSDGTVYVQTGDGRADLSNALLALTPRELQLKGFFAATGTRTQSPSLSDGSNVASPVVFSYNNRDLILSVCSDSSLCLVDSSDLGTNNHATEVHKTPPLSQPGRDVQSQAERGILA